MEASALKHASRSGLLARRSPMLRLQSDDRLVAMIRIGHDRAFEVLFDRYHARLLAFCRHMLRSSEDAEDVLQEVFTNAHAAMLGDDRHINVRPWLYRIARNRCLNHLRKPVPEGQESMDVHPHDAGTTTAERVQRREDFRALIADVQELPETQRTALLLRELDALSYEEIATAMDTTVPAVKSLLVRARMSLAEASQSRTLSCGDVQLELAEAAEGLRKASGPVRYHLRRCETCREYRSKLRANRRVLAGVAPTVLVVWLHKAFGGKLFGLGSGSSAAGSGAAAGATGSGAVAGGGAGTGAAATISGAAAAAGGAAGGIGGVVGAKAVAGIATAALLTAGAVEVRHLSQGERDGAERATTQGAPGPQGAAPLGLAEASEDRKRAEPRDVDDEREPDDAGDAAAAGTDAEPGRGEESGSAGSGGPEEPAPATEDDPAQIGVEGVVGPARKGSGRRGYRSRGSGSGTPPRPPRDPGDPGPPLDPPDPDPPTEPDHPVHPRDPGHRPWPPGRSAPEADSEHELPPGDGWARSSH